MSVYSRYYVPLLIIGIIAALVYVVSFVSLVIFIVGNMLNCVDCTITRVVVDNQGTIFPMAVVASISYIIQRAALHHLD